MNKYGLHGKLQARPGMGEQLESILLEASRPVAAAKGCQLLVSKDKNDADAVWVTEVWDSKADHNASLNLVGVKELIAQALPILDRLPGKGKELDIIGGLVG